MRKKTRLRKLKKISKKEETIFNPEIKKGILILFLVAFIIISFLSLFNLAGRFGFLLREKIIKIIFGKGYFIFPFLLSAITYLIIGTRKITLKFFHYLGIFFFILSFYGLLHLTIPLDKSLQSAAKGLGGGYAGVVLSYPMFYAFDFWGSFIILLIIFLASAMIVFNMTLDKLLSGTKTIKIFYNNLWQIFIIFKNKIFTKNYTDEEEYLENHNNYNDVSDQENNIGVSEQKTINNKNIITKNIQSEIKFTTGKIKRKINIPLDLLSFSGGKPTSGDINRNKELIKKTLESFNIKVDMEGVSIGPTVTQYTLKPAEGVKLSQIISLSNDLALSLAAHPIRIEAPIPGKSLVGVEVPNKTVAQVRVRDVINSPEFKKRESNLMISLGKDVTGKIWFADLTKNPHLLVAGSTGSGKTICINSIIISLIYQNYPEDLKFILVDPKQVELINYNGTPYLATPVIIDVKKTVNALHWAIGEMERRFAIFAEAGNRDINSYKAAGNSMASIIIIIDELADLMGAAGPELEALIIRLAQKSRATGIHLILATQRPSVNVITGVIKANITSRIAFRVASLVDSRTIIDSAGAEKLLGRGDMLFISADVSKPKRLQGAFVSENEVNRVTNYIRESFEEVEYDNEVIERPKNFDGIEISDKDDDKEEKIKEAIKIIIRDNKISISYLQRMMNVGYNKAAGIIDILEKREIISPSDGSNKARKILVSKEALKEEIGLQDDEE